MTDRVSAEVCCALREDERRVSHIDYLELYGA